MNQRLWMMFNAVNMTGSRMPWGMGLWHAYWETVLIALRWWKVLWVLHCMRKKAKQLQPLCCVPDYGMM